MIYGALTFNSRWISQIYSELATEHIITSPLYEGFEWFVDSFWVVVIPQEVLRQASWAGQRLQGVCYPNQNWSSFVVDVFPFIGCDFYWTWPWTMLQVCDFWLTLLKPMTKYQIAAINNYWEKCYEYLGTNGRTEVKQWSGGYNKAPMTYDHP